MNSINEITTTIGESPIWKTSSQSIIWVDAAGTDIYEYFINNGQINHFKTPFDITAIVPCDNDHWICASKQGLFYSSPSFDSFSLIENPFMHSPQLHMNDAVASPNGHLWFGSMNCEELESPDGKLFQLNNNSILEMDREFSVANGICFNQHLKRAYCSNMFQRKVYEYQLDESMTHILDKKIFVEFRSHEGLPDGLCADKYGNVYICHWDAGIISYYMPSPTRIGSAKKLGDIELPVKHATRCTFGGKYFDSLFVTTANYGLTQTEANLSPQSGQLFILDAPTKGNAEFRLISTLLPMKSTNTQALTS
ncbi:SMP-30/gluconolactonase/LRE family protein [Vibrio kyushuensis]|uniref:SMP-30/gluconolactonase/LRE family protein n=1 Tax=Vibrio kyushuensis TaxID=2910249 RepID=UPI003D13AAF4